MTHGEDGYALKDGELPQLMQEMENDSIRYFIESGVSVQSCEEVLQLCAEYPDRIFPAMGVFIPPGLFMRSGLTERIWMHLQRCPVLLLSVSVVWTITISVRSSTG